MPAIDVDQLCRLAVQLQRQGQLLQAEPLYRQIIAQNPNHLMAQYSLGVVLMFTGRNALALEPLAMAAKLRPNTVEIEYDLANAHHSLGHFDEAIAGYRRCIQINPNFAMGHNNLALALKDVCRFDEALGAHRRAVELEPHNAQFHDNLIFFLQYHPNSTAQSLLAEARLWNQKFVQPFAGAIQPHPNDRDPERPLRIGYVSADFRVHASIFFLVPLLQHHNPQQFEIFCYAEGNYEDEGSQQLRLLVRNWRNITALNDDQAAELIRHDRIDILVDLKLHTNQNRLLIFARKPASIQATWLGYPGTTGVETIDYRLTDPHIDPLPSDQRPGSTDAFYSETSLRLPDTFWCYDSLTDDSIPVNAQPALAPGAGVTFGSLNGSCKINEGCLNAWASILNAVPHSRLLLLAQEGSLRAMILKHFSTQGIDPARIEFAPRGARMEYLRTYSRIDIGLDTFPYNGHTTSLDALYMGVPVITLIGKTPVGRGGLSQLANLGLTELAATTPEEYVQIATALAADLPRLAKLRETLRPRMQKSSLMDAARFVGNMEAAYRTMWKKWCAR